MSAGLNTSTKMYPCANIIVVNIYGWYCREVNVLVPAGAESPIELVMLGENPNKLACKSTGQVYRQSNGYFEPVKGKVPPEQIAKMMHDAKELLLDSIWS